MIASSAIIKPSPFDNPIADPTPQEQTQPIGPVGWVSNASSGGGATVTIDADGITILNGALTIKDSSGNTTASDGVWRNGPGTVVINSSGITILNGALTLEDQFGNNVITGGGFGSSWLDFIDSRVYNAQFSAGTTNAIIAATEVGSGATVADYLASLSDDVPYWVIGSRGSDGTLSRVSDTAAPSAKALKWNAASAEIYQDIPVSPGQIYHAWLYWKYTNASSEFQVTVGTQFRDATHAAIGSVIETGNAINTTSSSYHWSEITTGGPTAAAPANARYLRAYITIGVNSGSPSVSVASVRADPVVQFGAPKFYDSSDQLIQMYSPSLSTTYPVMQLGGVSSGLYWGTGTAAVDAGLYRQTTGQVAITGDVSGVILNGHGTDAYFYLATTYGTWQTVSFEHSWVNYGGSYGNAAYMKDAFGVVHLRGMIKSGTVGSSAFTLPAGCRPPAQVLAVTISNSAIGSARHHDCWAGNPSRTLKTLGCPWTE